MEKIIAVREVKTSDKCGYNSFIQSNWKDIVLKQGIPDTANQLEMINLP